MPYNIGDKLNGKYYSGENYGFQSKESHEKLKKEGKYRAGTQVIDRAVSSGMRWANDNAKPVVDGIHGVLKATAGTIGYVRKTLDDNGLGVINDAADAVGNAYDQGVEFVSERTNIDKRIVGLATDAAIGAATGGAVTAAAKSIGAARAANGGVRFIRNINSVADGINLYSGVPLPNLSTTAYSKAQNLVRKATGQSGPLPAPGSLKNMQIPGANRVEAVFNSGSSTWIENGKVMQVRNYMSEGRPMGRNADPITRKNTRGSKTERDLKEFKQTPDGREGNLSQGEFYSTAPGEQAHHWLGIEFVERMTKGFDDALANKMYQQIQKVTGLFSGNHIANKYALPKDIHSRIHKAASKAGLDPTKIDLSNMSFDQRIEWLKARKELFDDLNAYTFELMNEFKATRSA